MSEFDKEAERQKLREKYERDEQKRQSTQRMSELLLKGATMTNKHCNQCGDPIFRYDGQEFCPTCQTQGQAAANADADAENAAEAVAQAETTPETAQGTAGNQQAAQDPQQSDGTATSTGSDQQSNASTATSTVENGQSTVDPSVPSSDPAEPRTSSPARESFEYTPRAVEGDVAEETSAGRRTQSGDVAERSSSGRRTQSGDVASARESLVRTLTWAANRAESTDDPRRATEFLSAAREAAEALAALDR